MRGAAPCRRVGLLAAAAVLAVASPPAAAQPVAKATFVAEGSFALPPGGSEALKDPIAIAWAPSGEIHVADEKGTISVFQPSGTLVRTYGGGVVKKVGGLALDAAGRAYVLDVDQKAVLVFGEGGEVVYRIGSKGSEAGSLDDPLDVTVGPAGLVYVLDKGRKGVQVFSLDGTFVHDILLPVDAKDPKAVGVSGSGAVFVADKESQGALVRLPDLTAALDLLDVPAPSVGRLTIRGGNVRDPVAVLGTRTGTVIVADRETGVLWAADATGAAPVGPDDRLYGGKGSGRGSFRKLVDAALAGSEELVMLDRDDRKVERVRLVVEAARPAEPAQDYPVQFQSVVPELDSGVVASAPTGRGTVWYAIVDAEGRNVRVVEARLEEQAGAYGSQIRLPVPTGSEHSFGQAVPRITAAALNDTLLVVTERGENRFHVFDLRNDQAVGSFGDKYSDDRRLRSPRGVAFFPDGRIAVADHDNGRVAVFSADLATLLGTFPLPKAEGVAISPQGRLFAWDEEGLAAGEIPLNGGAMQALPAPMRGGAVGALASDRAGNVYALRARTGRVAVADTALDRLVARLGSQKGLERGDQLTVDVDGNIFVTDLNKARSNVLRWGVDVAPVAAATTRWGRGFAELRWEAIPGSFITGYQVEGAEKPEGPWASVTMVREPQARVSGASRRWLRVAARTLTGALGRASPPVPSIHLAADTAFAARDWNGARTLGLEALRTIEARTVSAEPVLVEILVWQGFVAAHEAGDWKDVLEWQKRVGAAVAADRRFEHAFRIADAHQQLGDLPKATDEALRAIGLAGAAPPPAAAARLQTLRTMVFENGWQLGRWGDVTAAGEALLARAGNAADPQLVARLAHAHLKAGTSERALELARGGLGSPAAEGMARTFSTLAVIAAARMGDLATAKEYAAAVGDSVPADLYAEFESALAGVRLADGDVVGARAGLLAFLLGEENDVRALADPAVSRTAVLVYASLVESGDAEGGRRMLDSLVAAIPADLAEARDALLHQADSAAAVADTRLKLGEGFALYQQALFRDALKFFQAADARTDLDVDQRLIVKEILAAVFHSLGRVEDADAAFRGVFEVNPDFVLADHLAHVESTYGLVVFTPEMLEHFRTVGPIM